MTPAKVLVLQRKRREALATAELPIAQLSMLTYNMNRDPGDPKAGREPAPIKGLTEFQLFGKKKVTPLAAKDGPGGDHNLMGAKTDIGQWKAWAKGKTAEKGE